MTAYTAAPTSSCRITDVLLSSIRWRIAARSVCAPCFRESSLHVNEIPQHTRVLITRLLEAYCARLCPPAARNAVPIGFRLEADHVLIHELKRICGVPGTRHPSPVARFRYRSVTADWALDYFFENGWRRHRATATGSSFINLLREFDADPAGHFWGQLDGKSLRWCSARGRCNDCDLRYKRVLGLAVSPPEQEEETGGTTEFNVPSARL